MERRDEARIDGELRAQAVGPAVRVLCGIAAAVLLGVGLFYGVPFMLIAVPFGLLAARGWRAPIADPIATKRFLELADPSRPLTADDFVSGVPACEPPSRSGSAAPPSAAEAE